ncbi:MAG: Smr/MutS family protein [Bauldia sp.]
MRWRRDLTPEDRALWEAVTATMTPLRPRPPRAAAKAEAAPAALRPPTAPAAAKPAPRPAGLPHLAPIERRLATRVGRGRVSVDARLDLHGLTQHEAHERLKGFLARTQAAGGRMALVITGKGGGQPAFPGQAERGVLRRLVPFWLASPELRPLVIGFDEAQPGHGGSGALYVLVRRRRSAG